MKLLLFLLLIFLVLCGAIWLPTHAAAAPLAQAGGVYRVQAGDTLAAIAARNGTTVEALMQLNNLRNANMIYVGQSLIIRPGGGVPATGTGNVHVVRRGETLSGLSVRYGVSVAAIRQANGLRSNMIFIGQRLRIPVGGVTPAPAGQEITHVVQAGETLSSIALRYGVSVESLAARNGIGNASLIRVGQRLSISGNSAQPAAGGPKQLIVDISEQRCWRYEGETLLNVWRCSTGMKNATRTGTFYVQSKLRKAFGSTWNIWMPYWLGIYWAGPVENGFHGIPWNADSGQRIWEGLVGTPATFGCVMLHDDPMKVIWDWAEIGTKVVIRP